VSACCPASHVLIQALRNAPAFPARPSLILQLDLQWWMRVLTSSAKKGVYPKRYTVAATTHQCMHPPQ